MSQQFSNDADRQWFIVGRWQSFEGESRANLLRIICLGVFYCIELVQFHLLEEQTEVMANFHRGATLLCVVWSVVALGTLVCLRARVFPAMLKYIVTTIDIVLLTSLILLTEGAAQSSLVFAYFPILAIAALRFNVPLIWCATGGALAGYVSVLAISDMRNNSQWFDADHPAPLIDQLVILASLVLTGVILGQIVRRVRAIATDYAHRQRSTKAEEASQ